MARGTLHAFHTQPAHCSQPGCLALAANGAFKNGRRRDVAASRRLRLAQAHRADLTYSKPAAIVPGADFIASMPFSMCWISALSELENEARSAASRGIPGRPPAGGIETEAPTLIALAAAAITDAPATL
jgi:hypothetical protein